MPLRGVEVFFVQRRRFVDWLKIKSKKRKRVFPPGGFFANIDFGRFMRTQLPIEHRNAF